MLVKLVIFLELICYNDVKYIIRKDVTKGTVPLVNDSIYKCGTLRKEGATTETLRKEVVSVFLFKTKMTLSKFESVIVGYTL